MISYERVIICIKLECSKYACFVSSKSPHIRVRQTSMEVGFHGIHVRSQLTNLCESPAILNIRETYIPRKKIMCQPLVKQLKNIIRLK